MSTASDVPESGQLPGRFEWVPETTRGEVPSNPDFRLFSDVMRAFEAEEGVALGRQDALGTAYAKDHNRATEEPALTTGCDLQRFPVMPDVSDPGSSSQLGVQSTQSGDTGIDVVIYNDDESTSETITTDGTDGTTFVTGSTSFDTVGRVVTKDTHSGAIEVHTDSSGSPGTKLGEVPASGTAFPDPQPADPAGYGVLRDQYNRLPGSLTILARRESPGGNDSAGVREYTVVTGAVPESTSPTLDPSAANPILMEQEWAPVKVRSYLIHQPSASTALEVSSTSENDTMDLTVEDEGASTTDTVTLNGTTTVSITGPYTDVDAAWLTEAPEGTVTITDGSGVTIMTIEGGLTYSDDDNPVDGDRGVPVIGTGSRGASLGTSYEHFVGDRFERPSGSNVRSRVNSASWAVENDMETSSLARTRAPARDEGNATVTVEADVGGEFVSHNSMMEALQKVQDDLEHELTTGIVIFKNTVPTDAAARVMESDSGVVSESETLSASGDPAIEFASA